MMIINYNIIDITKRNTSTIQNKKNNLNYENI